MCENLAVISWQLSVTQPKRLLNEGRPDLIYAKVSLITVRLTLAPSRLQLIDVKRRLNTS